METKYISLFDNLKDFKKFSENNKLPNIKILQEFLLDITIINVKKSWSLIAN